MTGLFGESNLSNSILTGETMSDNIITTEERYTSATHASNLRCESDKPGQIDPIIAAGMSPSRLGAALLRLHSEYDGVAKPRAMASKQIAVIAKAFDSKGLPVVLTGAGVIAHKERRMNQANQMVGKWLANEITLFMVSLKSLPGVREQLAMAADRTGISREVSGAVLLWWLDHKCPACGGTALELVNGGKTGRACKKCRGTGNALLPGDDDGRRVEAYIKQCLDSARGSIGKRLRG
jgi:hypothetical protein